MAFGHIKCLFVGYGTSKFLFVENNNKSICIHTSSIVLYSSYWFNATRIGIVKEKKKKKTDLSTKFIHGFSCLTLNWSYTTLITMTNDKKNEFYKKNNNNKDLMCWAKFLLSTESTTEIYFLRVIL